MHRVVFLISYAVRFYLAIIDTHERTGADNIVPAIYLEGFQTGGAGRTILHLIEEDESVTCFYLERRIDEGEVLDDAIHLVTFFEDCLVFLLQYEVDGNHILIVVMGEL